MKHITEKYGTPENLMSCTNDEYVAIREMLKAICVETRITNRCGDSVTFQVCNPYRDNCILYKHCTGERISAITSANIRSGNYAQ